MTPKAARKQLDRLISAAWSRYASGVQVSVMDMPEIFRELRACIEAGASAEQAVTAAVRKWRKN